MNTKLNDGTSEYLRSMPTWSGCARGEIRTMNLQFWRVRDARPIVFSSHGLAGAIPVSKFQKGASQWNHG